MITPGDLLDLTVETVAYRGSGIARHEGCVVFVAGVAPGERVRVRVDRLRRNYAEARLLAVLASAPERIAPCCRLADGTRVPGCVYDHLAYPAEVALKHRQAGEFLGLLPGAAGARILPAVPSPADRHYRNKIVLHAQRARRGLPALVLGYLGDDNRTVVDIPACPLACAPINEALAAFRVSREFGRQPDGGSDTFRWTAADGVRRWSGGDAPPAERLTEETPLGPVAVPAGAFHQVNPGLAPALVRQVSEWFGEAGGAGADVLDLYCGVGAFGLACGRAGARRVVGIETGRDAVAAARDNARRHAIPAVFHCRTAAEAAAGGFDGVALGAATVVVDPPRQGLEPAVTAALARLRPARILYVSCDPATLARDLRALLPAGYELRVWRVFDLFPRTAHFETVVWLERR